MEANFTLIIYFIYFFTFIYPGALRNKDRSYMGPFFTWFQHYIRNKEYSQSIYFDNDRSSKKWNKQGKWYIQNKRSLRAISSIYIV